jgi:hypothetical protein
VQAAYHGITVRGGTLYCTHQPYLACVKLLINAGIARVYYLGTHLPSVIVACKPVSTKAFDAFPRLSVRSQIGNPGSCSVAGSSRATALRSSARLPAGRASHPGEQHPTGRGSGYHAFSEGAHGRQMHSVQWQVHSR